MRSLEARVLVTRALSRSVTVLRLAEVTDHAFTSYAPPLKRISGVALTLEQRCRVLAQVRPDHGLADQLTETAESLMILAAELRYVLAESGLDHDTTRADIQALLTEIEGSRSQS